MANVDIDPFGEHESRTEESTDENIPLDLVTPGGWPKPELHSNPMNLGTGT